MVSLGCIYCYAEARDRRHLIEDVDHWGKGAPRRKSLSAVQTAFRLNKKPWVCDVCGTAYEDQLLCSCETLTDLHRRRVFSLSLGDWLDPEVPIEWFVEMLDTIRQCTELDFLLCTKRPELFWGHESPCYVQGRLEAAQNAVPDSDLKRWLCEWGNGKAPKNVWVIASVENQAMLEKRVPELLKIPAVVHGLSCEPLLGPLNFQACVPNSIETFNLGTIDWVIAGGESGKEARPCDVEWLRSIQRQCKVGGVPYFCKQLGRDPQWSAKDIDERWYERFAEKQGAEPLEWPLDMRVREFPRVEGR